VHQATGSVRLTASAMPSSIARRRSDRGLNPASFHEIRDCFSAGARPHRDAGREGRRASRPYVGVGSHIDERR
jgi:hypothetical protein